MGGPKLAYRPDPCDGESWPGYLLRLANHNGLRGLRSIATLLQMTEERLLRADIYDIGDRLRLPYPEDGGEDGRAYRGHLKMRTRVCPECLSSDKIPFIRSAWDSPLKLHCELHRKLLVDTCPVCFRHLSYTRASLEVCRCGVRIGSWASTSTEAWMRDLYETTQTQATVERHRPTFSPIADEDLKGADLLIQLVRLYKRQRHLVIKQRAPRFKFVASVDLEVLKQIFGRVPDSMRVNIAKWQASGVALNKVPVQAGSMFHSIWLMIRSDIKRAKVALLDPINQPPAGFVSKRRLMNETGLHPTAIDYLIEVGLLRGVVKVGGATEFTGRYLIPEEEFQGLLALHKGSMAIQQAADFALVRPSTIRILGYSSAIQTYRFGKCKYMFRVKSTDLAAVVHQVRSKAYTRRGSVEDLISIEDALTVLYRLATTLPRKLLDEICADRLRVVILSKHAIHLGECYLESQAFQNWCHAFSLIGARRVNKVPG